MTIRDQIGHEVVIDSSNNCTRIISLVPSQTELLVDLDQETNLVGITRFCTHPKHLRSSIKMVGGTKDLDFELIKSLNPDVVICNKEENNKEHVLNLQKLYPTYTSDVNNLHDALNMISDLGVLTHSKNKSKELIEQIRSDFDKLKNKFSGTVAYLIWNDPIMLAGQKTFIHSVLSHLGFKNFVSEKDSRYPKINENELSNSKIDFIFLSSEPYPFKEKNKKEFQKKHPKAQIILVDGRMFSWYGSCLAGVLKYFVTLTKQISPNSSD